MNKLETEIQGFEELQRKIKLLGNDRLKRNEMLKIQRQVAKSTVGAARSQAPVSKKAHVISGSRARKVIQPGQLRDSIGTITGKAKTKAVIYVGPRTKGKWDGWYGAMVHGGTVLQKANPFMQRAYNQTQGRIVPELESKVTRYVQKQIDKLSNA